MSEKSREELLLEYEKEYLQRLANEGKLKDDDVKKSEEVRNEMTVEEAEKVQADAAAEVQASSAAKNQSEDEQKKSKQDEDNAGSDGDYDFDDYSMNEELVDLSLIHI